MIVNIQDTDDESFLRHWSERVYDQMQLTQIAEVEKQLVTYALTAWRPMSIPPPSDILLICTVDEGVVLMTQTQPGVWRTSQGMPHKPPRAWMPCPAPHVDRRA